MAEIILFTTNFSDSECFTFYRGILGLKILFEKETLTCFDFGENHLLIKPKNDKSINENNNSFNKNLCLKFNVTKFQESCKG
ncbi:catechol-2,3-dioxygenase [Flammeovirga kamogawensis]|nr:catechol-2,3-dioxygenase [Flammeovirga kamogawensis]